MNVIEELKSYAQSEKRIHFEILLRLEIVERQKLFAPLYTSMTEFCRKELDYTDSETQVRLDAMRTLKKVPSLKRYLREGSLSVSQILILGRLEREAVREGKIFDVLSLAQEVQNKSVRATEDLIRVKKGLPKKYSIVLKVSEELQQEWLYYRNSHFKKSDEELFRPMLDRVLHFQKLTATPRKLSQAGRAPTPQLRKLLLQRANFKCEHRNCNNRMNLQVDHIHPYALGGKTELSNLRILCQTHNLLRI